MQPGVRPHRRGIGARLWVAGRRGRAHELLGEAFAYYGESAVEGLFSGVDVFRADGVSVVGAHEVIEEGEGVWVFAPVPDEPEQPIELPVVAESDHWIVVDKPHGIATTPRGSHVARSVTVAARRQFSSDVLSPAHRLDADTAGLVLLVKEPEWRGRYQLLFERRRVEKRYRAVARRGDFTEHTSRLYITKQNGIFHADVVCVNPACPCGGQRFGEPDVSGSRVDVFDGGADVSVGAGALAFSGEGAMLKDDTLAPNAVTEIRLAGHYTLDAGSTVNGVSTLNEVSTVELPPALRFGVDVPAGLDADDYQLPVGGALSGNVSNKNVNTQKVELHNVSAGQSINTQPAALLAPEVGMYEVRPLTGKTHQIRVAFAHLGLGIVGDRMYPVRDAAWGSGKAVGRHVPSTQLVGGVPLQLHAYYLAFRDPITGEDVELASQHHLALWAAEAEGA